MKHLFLTVFASTILFASSLWGQTIKKPSYIPAGWNIPSAENFTANSGWTYFLSKGNSFPFYTTGDFNGDQTTDYVWTLIKSDKTSWEVFAFISNSSGGFDKIDIGGKRATYTDPMNLYTGEITNTELVFMSKGEKLCQYDDNMNVKRTIVAKYDIIMFGVYEGDRTAYYFNSSTKKFERFFNCMQ